MNFGGLGTCRLSLWQAEKVEEKRRRHFVSRLMDKPAPSVFFDGAGPPFGIKTKRSFIVLTAPPILTKSTELWLSALLTICACSYVSKYHHSCTEAGSTATHWKARIDWIDWVQLRKLGALSDADNQAIKNSWIRTPIGFGSISPGGHRVSQVFPSRD